MSKKSQSKQAKQPRRSGSAFTSASDGMLAKSLRGSAIVAVFQYQEENEAAAIKRTLQGISATKAIKSEVSDAIRQGYEAYMVTVDGTAVGVRFSMSGARRLRYQSEHKVTAAALTKVRKQAAKRKSATK